MLRKTYKDKNGYLRFNGSNKLVHRWVVEKELGHPLPKGSVVHHKNRNKLDNRLSNLKVYSSQKQHEAAHGFVSTRVVVSIIVAFIIFILLISLLSNCRPL